MERPITTTDPTNKRTAMMIRSGNGRGSAGTINRIGFDGWRYGIIPRGFFLFISLRVNRRRRSRLRARERGAGDGWEGVEASERQPSRLIGIHQRKRSPSRRFVSHATIFLSTREYCRNAFPPYLAPATQPYQLNLSQVRITKTALLCDCTRTFASTIEAASPASQLGQIDRKGSSKEIARSPVR